MKKAACFALFALCASTGAQAHTPAEMQYQQDQIALMKARNRCEEIATAQMHMKQPKDQFSWITGAPDAALEEVARKAPPLTREICDQNHARKSAELDARQPQEIKDDNARMMREAAAANDALNAEAIR